MKEKRVKNIRPSGNELHTNPWFSVCNRDGFFTVEFHSIQVVIAAVIDDSHVVMVKVKRPVIEGDAWELPAGGCENDESPLQAAARELGEETGIEIEPERLTKMGEYHALPNRTPVPIYVYPVDITGGEFDKRKPHDNEVVEVQRIDFDTIKKMIVSFDISVTLPVAILSNLLFRLDKNDVDQE